jgi:hypothetical protein
MNTGFFVWNILFHTVPHQRRITMTIKDEMDKITSAGGRYIPPYKLVKITDLAGKIIKLLTNNGMDSTFCYDDMNLTLDVVREIINKGRGK